MITTAHVASGCGIARIIPTSNRISIMIEFADNWGWTSHGLATSPTAIDTIGPGAGGYMDLRNGALALDARLTRHTVGSIELLAFHLSLPYVAPALELALRFGSSLAFYNQGHTLKLSSTQRGVEEAVALAVALLIAWRRKKMADSETPTAIFLLLEDVNSR